MTEKVGVYVCHCGTNIAGIVDVEQVAQWAGSHLKKDGVIIARDYALGERWRKKIAGQNIDASGSPTIVEILILVLAVLGLLMFIGGMLGQAYVATNLM